MRAYESPASWYRFDDLGEWLFEEEEDSSAFHKTEGDGALRITAFEIDVPLSATGELERYLDGEGLSTSGIETELLDNGTEIASADLPTMPDLLGKVWFLSKGNYLRFATYYYEENPAASELPEADALIRSVLIARLTLVSF